MQLHKKIHRFWDRGPGPNFDLLSCPRIYDSDVRVGILAVAGMEVVLDVLVSPWIILGVLHENKIFFDCLFDLGVLPDIPIEYLTIKNGWILYIHYYPFFIFLPFVTSLVPGEL